MSSMTCLYPVEFDRPYPGLRPYDSGEALLFFGRDEQVEVILAKLASHRFLALVGVSGCGKSSLARAGVIPALKMGQFESAGYRWQVVTMRPGRRPLGNLADALNRAGIFDRDPGEAGGAPPIDGGRAITPFVLASLRRGPRGLVDVLAEPLPGCTAGALPGGENLLLLVDQFEEILRFRREGDDRARNEADAFVALLLASVRQSRVPIYVILTMRSDYLGDCAVFRDLPEAISESQFLAPRLTRDQLRAAIEGPARAAGGRVEPALVNRLLNDMGTDPDQLLLMQHALMYLWDRAQAGRRSAADAQPDDGAGGTVLTLEDYDRLGGLENALDVHANDVYLERLGGELRTIAEVLFRCLGERELGGPEGVARDVRRPTSVRTIARVTGVEDEVIVKVADCFRARDVSFLGPLPPDVALEPETELDVLHESLFRRWTRAREWADDEAKVAERIRELARRARRWRESLHGAERGRPAYNPAGPERDDGTPQREEGIGLLTPPELDADLALWREQERNRHHWPDRYGKDLVPFFGLVEQFLKASQGKRSADELQRRRGKYLESGFHVALILLAVLAPLAVVSVWNNRELDRKNRALVTETQNTKLANEKAELATKLAELATLLNVAESALPDRSEYGLALAREAMTISEDLGSRAGGMSSGEAKLVQAARARTQETLRRALSSIGGRPLTWQGQVGINGERSKKLGQPAFSPDGRWLVGAESPRNPDGSASGAVVLWRLPTDEGLIPAPIPPGTRILEALPSTRAVMFSSPRCRSGPRLIVRDSVAGLIRLLDLTKVDLAKGTAQDWVELEGPPSIFLSGYGHTHRNGRERDWYVAVGHGPARQPARAVLWDVSAPRPVPTELSFGAEPPGRTSMPRFHSFSPDGRWFCLMCPNGIGYRWDLDRPGLPAAVLEPPVGTKGIEVKNCVFSLAGSRLVVTHADARAYYYNPASPEESPQLVPLRLPDQETMITYGTDSRGLLAITTIPEQIGPQARGKAPATGAHPTGVARGPSGSVSQQAPAGPSAATSAWLWDLSGADTAPKPLRLEWFHAAEAWVLPLISTDAWRGNPAPPRPEEEETPLRADPRWLVVRDRKGEARLWYIARKPPGHLVGSSLPPEVFVNEPRQPFALSERPRPAFSQPGASPGDDPLWPTTQLAPDTQYRWLIVRKKSSRIAEAIDLDALLAAAPLAGVPLRGHDQRVDNLGISPDGRWALTGSDDGNLRLWDLSLLSPSADPLALSGVPSGRGHILSKDRRWLISAGRDGHMQFYDLKSERASIPVRSARQDVAVMESSLDDRWCVTRTKGGTATLWDLDAPSPPEASTDLGNLGTAYFESIFARPGGGLIAVVLAVPTADPAAPPAREVRLWRLDASRRLATEIAVKPRGEVVAPAPWAGAIDPTCRWLVSSEGNTFYLKELDGPGESIALPGQGDTSKSGSPQFSPDGRWLFLWRQGERGLCWELREGGAAARPIGLDPDNRGFEDSTMFFSSDGRRLFQAYPDQRGIGVRYWLLEPGKTTVASQAVPGLAPVAGVRTRVVFIDRRGRWLLGRAIDTPTEENARLRVWDLTDPDASTRRANLPPEKAPPDAAVAISRDGRWFVSLGKDKVYLWDTDAILGNPAPRETAVLGGFEGLNVGFRVGVHADASGVRWVALSGWRGAIYLWIRTGNSWPDRPEILPSSTSVYVDDFALSGDGGWFFATEYRNLSVSSVTLKHLQEVARVTSGRSISDAEWDRISFRPRRQGSDAAAGPGHGPAARPGP